MADTDTDMIGNNIWDDEARRGLLHIYPQPIYHGSAKVHGSPEALRCLGQALIDAAGRGQCGETAVAMMAADGEWYEVEIRAMSDRQMEARPMPYAQPGLPWEVDRCWDCPRNKPECERAAEEPADG